MEFFKSKETKERESHEKEQKIIAEIHSEFDTAEDRLLTEAKTILDNIVIKDVTAEEEKSKRLKSLGFKNTIEVENVKHLIDERNQSLKNKRITRNFAELIQYYKQTYPFQKFLTEEEMIRICKKYNLIYAPVSHFSGIVPDKNLTEIENAKPLSRSDSPGNKTYIKVTKYWDGVPREIKKLLDNDFLYSGYINSDGNPSESVLRKAIIEAGYTGNYFETGDKWIYHDAQLKIVEKTGLFICAPKKDFNLDGLDMDTKFGYTKNTVIEIKDPIVFRYCDGGIQVISKWGLEASDPLLYNPIEN